MCTLLFACRSPRQAITVLEVSPKLEYVVKDTIIVPGTTADTTLLVATNLDSIFVELENSWLTINRLSSQNDSLQKVNYKVVTKPVKFIEFDTVAFQVLTIRTPGMDSIYSIANGDTTFLYSLANDYKAKALPGKIKEAAKGDRIPWEAIIIAFVGLIAFFAKKNKKNV